MNFNPETAQQLLEELNPTGKNFQAWDCYGDPEQYALDFWYFRGHADARWELTPTVFRVKELNWLPDKMIWEIRNNLTAKKVILLELLLTQSFIHYSDVSGLPLPIDSMGRRNAILQQLKDTSDDRLLQNWPQDEIIPLLALMQHHGIPTRLLDWTKNPYTACYFAASGAVAHLRNGNPKGVTHIEIIAISNMAYSEYESLSRFGSFQLKLVPLPTGGNPNLIAQEGKFSMTTQPNLALEIPADLRGLDAIVAAEHEYLGKKMFRKFRLPIGEAAELMRLLAKYGTTASRLFPGFDGVSRAIKDESHWVHMLGDWLTDRFQ